MSEDEPIAGAKEAARPGFRIELRAPPTDKRFREARDAIERHVARVCQEAHERSERLAQEFSNAVAKAVSYAVVPRGHRVISVHGRPYLQLCVPESEVRGPSVVASTPGVGISAPGYVSRKLDHELPCDEQWGEEFEV